MTFVLDHLGKPAIADGQLEPWGSELAELARLPNVFAKLSGLTTEAKPGEWTPEDLAPYLQRALELFGPDRLMFGSDWPRSNALAHYGETLNALRMVLGPVLDEEENEDVFGVNAAAFYDVSLF